LVLVFIFSPDKVVLDQIGSTQMAGKESAGPNRPAPNPDYSKLSNFGISGFIEQR